MNKQKIIPIYISLVVLLVLITNTIAAAIEPPLMLRSSETLKFHAKKTETVGFSGGSAESLRSFSQIKPKDDKKNVKKDVANDSPRPSKSTSFSVLSEFIEAQNAYKLTITDSTGGGVLLSQNASDQAPADGYTPSVECLLPLQTKAYETTKYVYLKTKTGDETTPYQYSRLELNMTIGRAKLIIDMNAVTNSGGSSDLKYDKRAQMKYISERINEIQAAIKNKTATDDQIEEVRELTVIQSRERNSDRWDFEGNRKHILQQKRQKFLEADGRIKL